MSGGGGKGGSQTSETKIPEWVEDASKQNLSRANEIAQIGYTPYYGPDVAAFNPMQQASFANTGQAAGAFGMQGGGMTGMEGMPQAQDFGGGLLGYSSAPIYEQSMNTFEQQNPGQMQAMNNLFMDPQTGAPAPGYRGGHSGMADKGGSTGVMQDKMSGALFSESGGY